MGKFRKRPIEIEARRIELGNIGEIVAWCGGRSGGPDSIGHARTMTIPTLEGVMGASMGDWIVKGVKGEFYPVKDDIFRASYDPVLEPEVTAAIAAGMETARSIKWLKMMYGEPATDLRYLEALLTERGIGFKASNHDPFVVLELEVGFSKVEGYSGFNASLRFDASGTLLDIGIGEG